MIELMTDGQRLAYLRAVLEGISAIVATNKNPDSLDSIGKLCEVAVKKVYKEA